MSHPYRPPDLGFVRIFARRERSTAASESSEGPAGGPLQLRSRLEAYRAAFLRDPSPALLFEAGTTVLVNDAARVLFADLENVCAIVELLKVSAAGLGISVEPLVQIRGSMYRADFNPKPVRPFPPVVICRLLRLESDFREFNLTKRELTIVDLLWRGFGTSRMATELGISNETVRKHIAAAFKKTGCRNRAELMACFLRNRRS
jgi:DNA-binding CsgD family transcriptional regulator